MASNEPSIRPARREVMVLMFTDVVASTTAKTRIGTTYFEENLVRHEEIFRHLMAQVADGEILRETGDGFFARFRRASDAVLVALRFQERIRAESWLGEPLEIKTGIHQGEALQRESYIGEPLKIVGLTADLAARLTALAGPRQILLSRAAFDDALQFLQGDRIQELPYPVRWHSHGLHTLLGSQELPMEVLEVGHAEQAAFRLPQSARGSHVSTSEGVSTATPACHSLGTRIKFVHRLAKAAHWQDRHELDELRSWWQTTESGVCALVGIGGAGKTSMVDRFLWQLPDLLPKRADVAQDRSLAAPESALVYSFFEAPATESFLIPLARWLGSLDVSDSNASYHRIMEILEQPGPTRLIVLDGLEKVQEEGLRGGSPGEIHDARLRDFLLRASDGAIPGLRMIVTSRFPVIDAIAHACPLYQAIGVDDLSSQAAIKLFQAKGVRGSDRELEELAADYRFHALSIDLLGGYLKRFADGRPVRYLPLSERPADRPSSDTHASPLRLQEQRFEDIAERYRTMLLQQDPATLRLLEVVCLFRLGVNSKALASIFLGADKLNVSGHDLANLTPPQLQQRLQLLTELGLIETMSPRGTEAGAWTFNTHPAVRDSFLRGLQGATQHTSHAAVCQHLLSSIPDTLHRLDIRHLDLVEETIFHALSAGQLHEAWRLYSHHLGGYDFLGRHLGLYKRGERLCRMMLKQATWVQEERLELQNDLSLYLRNVGQIGEAIVQQQQNVADRPIGSRSKELQILAQLESVQGHLLSAQRTATQAVEDAGNRRTMLEACLATRAQIFALQGKLSEAFADFEAARELQNQIDGTEQLYSLRGVHYAQLLQRVQQQNLARRQTRWNRRELIRRYGHDHQHVASCDLLLASLWLDAGLISRARKSLAAAFDWAVTRDAHEHLCQAAALKALLTLAEAKSTQSVRTDGGAFIALESALRVASEAYLGLHRIDLLLVRSRLYLAMGELDQAIEDAQEALFGRNQSDQRVDIRHEFGSEPVAACHREVQYVWAEIAGYKLLGEALHRKVVRGDLPPLQVRNSLHEALRHLESSQTKECHMGLTSDVRIDAMTAEIRSRLG